AGGIVHRPKTAEQRHAGWVDCDPPPTMPDDAGHACHRSADRSLSCEEFFGPWCETTAAFVYKTLELSPLSVDTPNLVNDPVGFERIEYTRLRNCRTMAERLSGSQCNSTPGPTTGDRRGPGRKGSPRGRG